MTSSVQCDIIGTGEVPNDDADDVQTFWMALMTQIATIDKLRSVVENLPDSQKNFARSLIEQYDRKQSLSVRQWPYVQKLFDAATKSAEPAPVAEEIGNLSSIVELFDNAKSSGIKFPKIRFGHDDHSIVLSVAGPNARFPGTINIVCDEVWLGRVTREGYFTNPRKVEAPFDVKEMLLKLADNPREEMEVYGRRTGNCCLCGKTLTNEGSIEAGIGPICAGKWGV